MSGFDKPNFTMTPNMLFDELMKDMSEAELKVTLAIVRKTFGYHKQRDQISLTQLEELTGLSRRACVDGVEAVITRGLVQRGESGKRGITTFELVINNDQLQFVTSSGDNKLPVTSDNLKHTKEKEYKKSKSSAVKPRRVNPVFELVAHTSFGIEDTTGLDKESGARIGKITAWLKKHDATIENLEAFYLWYVRETKGASHLRDIDKFAEWYVKFEQAISKSTANIIPFDPTKWTVPELEQVS